MKVTVDMQKCGVYIGFCLKQETDEAACEYPCSLGIAGRKAACSFEKSKPLKVISDSTWQILVIFVLFLCIDVFLL